MNDLSEMSARMIIAGLKARLTESQAEVARRVANLAECYRISGADPDNASNVFLAEEAVRAVTDLRRDYDEACEEAHSLRAEVARLRAALVELLAEAEEGIATCPLTRAAARAALEPTR